MTTTSRTINPPHSVSHVLRDLGYVPLPRLWVKSEVMEQIHAIAHTFQDEVNEIRSKIHHELSSSHVVNRSYRADPTVEDPKLDRDAAWAAYEALRQTG